MISLERLEYAIKRALQDNGIYFEQHTTDEVVEIIANAVMDEVDK